METATSSQYFQVEGIRCARCIHAIESRLQSEEHITHARVNMSTSRLLVQWEGEDEDMLEHIISTLASLGYKASPFTQKEDDGKSEDRRLLRYTAIAGFAMGNIMLISVALWSSDQELMGMATRDLFHWISAAIALPTIFYAGRPFFGSALGVLRKGHTNMDVPISLALILACGMSVFETINHGEHAYFDSAVMLLFFLLIGRWLDARARSKARENATSLLALMRGTATVIDGNKTHKVPIEELREGMLLRVAAGEKIPTDCELVEGESELDTSLVTGESLPRVIRQGDTLYGGTINLAAPITCRVQKASEDSLLAEIIRLMEQAEQGRARYVHLADRAARLYTPVVHTLAACAFVGWLVLGGASWQASLLIAITTLIITCPCALGLAVPVVQVLTTSWLMKRGVMVKSGDALERMAAIDTVVLDKTGTLTKGTPVLESVPDAQWLPLAASLAAHSHHPYSKAIAAAYEGDVLPLENIQEEAGVGVHAQWDSQHVQLGRSQNEEAQVSLYVENAEVTSFILTDELRADTLEIVAKLKEAGLQLWLLSGDRATITQNVAKALGIEHFKAECLPNDKIQTITMLQAAGHKVLMVGDGLNDAPSLAKADVSLSPASGVDITQNSADMVMRSDKLAPLLQSWRMARFSTQLVKQNFGLAVAYNCIAIPLAVAGYVTPLVAAISMSASSLIVIANSFRINLRAD